MSESTAETEWEVHESCIDRHIDKHPGDFNLVRKTDPSHGSTM